ncbi:hypothetical protein PQH03_05470 [Ralstonia insidiosa]|jgi:hypothetical protein|uniref:hypothetical protein n=1 Tax=Ralstonia TaxID=48736 RepID=UPI0006648F1B|nr:hypothetical protein [Ralstonia insidiosa]KMW48193.1 hypothetical protein AC240_07620 [Ralstonia sp. MD27]MBX3770198.1 hypothetical protein [Ralstonia pickettii]NOZ15803.1 hypothetical protein [Betaproteobacteria bacterium]MBA9854359.1 hypothetical protein [Ralstonia insidiosa]MBA9868174.1 hypothetical protein [Ralstonia insidiosa]
MRTLHRVMLMLAALGVAACAPAIVGPYYTMDVRLADGKPVRCAVNQPVHLPAPPPAPLSTRERNEAEVLATQPLRLQSGPRAPYPTVYTAPDVQCFALSS